MYTYYMILPKVKKLKQYLSTMCLLASKHSALTGSSTGVDKAGKNANLIPVNFSRVVTGRQV